VGNKRGTEVARGSKKFWRLPDAPLELLGAEHSSLSAFFLSPVFRSNFPAVSALARLSAFGYRMAGLCEHGNELRLS
jgi:hypothetical protein